MVHDDDRGRWTVRPVVDPLDADAAHVHSPNLAADRGRDGRPFPLELGPEELKKHRLSPLSAASLKLRYRPPACKFNPPLSSTPSFRIMAGGQGAHCPWPDPASEAPGSGPMRTVRLAGSLGTIPPRSAPLLIPRQKAYQPPGLRSTRRVRRRVDDPVATGRLASPLLRNCEGEVVRLATTNAQPANGSRLGAMAERAGGRVMPPWRRPCSGSVAPRAAPARSRASASGRPGRSRSPRSDTRPAPWRCG